MAKPQGSKGNALGRGAGSDAGQGMGHGGGARRQGQDGEIGQHRDAAQTRTGRSETQRGRSGSSPGHLKREAGARSARDYAPGRGGRSGASSEENALGRSSRDTVLAEVAPDELAER